MTTGRTLLLAAFVSAAVAAAVAAVTTVVVFVVVSGASDGPGGSADAASAPLGADVHGELDGSEDAELRYVFRIPDDAVQIDAVLESDEGRVALRAACCDAAADDHPDWTWSAEPEGNRAKLSITRHADHEFDPGPLVVEVRPALFATHRGGKERISFTLHVDAKTLGAPRAIRPGVAIDAVAAPETGHRCDFVVGVPEDADAVRIDLVEAERDLDVLASAESPAMDGSSADWEATSTLARESLVVLRESVPGFPAGGELHFCVIDPSVYDAPVSFRVVVTLGRDPPAEALALPPLPIPTDPRERAVASVVEIVVDDGAGSGTIVREDGLVLTARHVIGDRTGERGDITVAIDLDPTRVTRDLFHAKLVRSDEALDLALLKIVTGLHGQPLPEGYRFPSCPVAFDAVPRLGDPLVTIGFPEPAGTGTRAPVLFSRGVVSGFEREKSGVRIKTDAFVASGSSGGAALDASYRLVGIPVFTVTESEGTAQLGFLVQTSEIPAEWRAMISK